MRSSYFFYEISQNLPSERAALSQATQNIYVYNDDGEDDDDDDDVETHT